MQVAMYSTVMALLTVSELTRTELTTEWYSESVCRDGSVRLFVLMVPTANSYPAINVIISVPRSNCGLFPHLMYRLRYILSRLGSSRGTDTATCW